MLRTLARTITQRLTRRRTSTPQLDMTGPATCYQQRTGAHPAR